MGRADAHELVALSGLSHADLVVRIQRFIESYGDYNERRLLRAARRDWDGLRLHIGVTREYHEIQPP